MERAPENKTEYTKEQMIEVARKWAEELSKEALEKGEALNDEETALAREVGVEEPEKVRVLTVDSIPSPSDEGLVRAVKSLGFEFDRFRGLTLGYAVYIVNGYRNSRLMSHELRHVAQYEEFGSADEFLQEYLSQLIACGYKDAPLEIDARNHESTENILTPEERIKNAVSFDELYEIISDLGEMIGESGTYSSEYLIKRIEQVRHGHRDIAFVTRALGLREKVTTLLPDDPVYKKYVKKR